MLPAVSWCLGISSSVNLLDRLGVVVVYHFLSAFDRYVRESLVWQHSFICLEAFVIFPVRRQYVASNLILSNGLSDYLLEYWILCDRLSIIFDVAFCVFAVGLCDILLINIFQVIRALGSIVYVFYSMIWFSELLRLFILKFYCDNVFSGHRTCLLLSTLVEVVSSSLSMIAERLSEHHVFLPVITLLPGWRLKFCWSRNFSTLCSYWLSWLLRSILVVGFGDGSGKPSVVVAKVTQPADQLNPFEVFIITIDGLPAWD